MCGGVQVGSVRGDGRGRGQGGGRGQGYGAMRKEGRAGPRALNFACTNFYRMMTKFACTCLCAG